MADGHRIPGDARAFQVAPTTPLARAAFRAARPFFPPLLGLGGLTDLHRRSAARPECSFEGRLLRALDIRVAVQGSGGLAIPPWGPLLVAANHPTGALDGIVLTEVVRRVRPDVRLLANHLLSKIPELRPSCFFVDPFGGRSAAARSRSGLRAAHLWLRGGGALVMFPAGEVAWKRVEDGFIDSRWAPTVGRLVMATGATVLPVFLDGRNSSLFYAAGRIHPLLRTALLGRELLNKHGRTVRIVVAPAMRFHASPADHVTASIRSTVDALGSDKGQTGVKPRSDQGAEGPPESDPALLERDVLALPPDARLVTSGDYDVYLAGASRLPYVLQEIGRLRETTFRLVGEGTGRETDLDRFDRHYRHLFVWNRGRREIAGAYRVCGTDEALRTHGLEGLYTRTLFRYDEALLQRIGPALELGRSFVRQEYQRSYAALLLLWKGIGRIVARSPQYKVLFGPVSISSRYQDASQQILRAFLAQQHGDAALSGLVRPVNPPAPLPQPARAGVTPADVDSADRVIAQMEGRQGMPVLLRQYLRLKATTLGFNVDPDFHDALDALMMVDLTRLPPATLQRYLGRDASAFLAHHRASRTRAA